MEKIKSWVRQPKNIIFLLLMIAVFISGIINGNILSIVKAYSLMILVGIVAGFIFYLKDRFMK